jgi:hypothetical protein
MVGYKSPTILESKMSIIVNCKCKSALMKASHGDEVCLELCMARRMEAAGDIIIVGRQDGQPMVKPIPEMNDTDYLYRLGFNDKETLTRIAWVQDYHKNGGAELSSQVVVSVGSKLGFDIVGITPENFNEEALQKCDLVILNNCFEFDERQFHIIQQTILGTGKKPYIKYEHDHRELWLRKPIGERFFQEAKKCFFISPAHLQRHADGFGEWIREKAVVLPLAMRPERWKPVEGIQRKANSFFIPGYTKARETSDEFIKQHPGAEIALMGNNGPVLNNVKILPEVTHDKMPAIYSEYETVVHLPGKPGSGERVLFEAILCGCKVITNSNGSHSSWDFWQDTNILREKLTAAPYTFWKEVSEIAKDCRKAI